MTQDSLTKAEQNRALAKKWVDLYNGEDMEAFVELYGPDGTVTLFDGFANPGKTPSITDLKFLVRHQNNMRKEMPGRYLKIRRIVATEEVATVEADYTDLNNPDFFLPMCAVLTIENGYVKSDHSYLHRDSLPGATTSLPGE